jgi:putative pyrroloquinoline-quinone binding quinoprotein
MFKSIICVAVAVAAAAALSALGVGGGGAAGAAARAGQPVRHSAAGGPRAAAVPAVPARVARGRGDFAGGYSVAAGPGGGRVFVTGSTGGGYATIAYSAATGAQLWAQRYNVPGGGAAYSVAVSPGGDKVFVTGQSYAAASASDYATIAYNAATGAQLWVKRYNSGGANYDAASTVAVAPDGTKVFVTGTGDGVLNSGGDYVGQNYVTIAYRASTGARLWVKRYSGPGNGNDVARSVAVSPGGGMVLVTGSSPAAASGEDYATIAYSTATGAQLWAKRYQGPAYTDYGGAYSVAVAPGGDKVFVTGESQGVTSGTDYATIAYSAATGAQLWAKRYNSGADHNDAAMSVAVGPRGGKVFVTGRWDTVTYDAATGAQLWARSYVGRYGSDINYSVAVRPSGDIVYVTGGEIGGDETGEYDTIAYNTATGGQLWAQNWTPPGVWPAEAYSVAVSPRGDKVFITGSSLGGTGYSDYATIAYNSTTGAQLWVQYYPGNPQHQR